MKSMKTLLLTSSALTLALTMGLAHACPPDGRGGHDARGGHGGPEGRLEAMGEALQLTAEQKTQLKVVLEAGKERREAQREAMKTEMRSKMASILTPEQLQQWETIQQWEGTKRNRRDNHVEAPGQLGEDAF